MTEPTNQQRADRVAEYVKDYFAKYEGGGEDLSTTVQDIVSDLLHYNRIAAASFAQRDIVAADDLLQSARDRFLEEVEEETYA